HAAELTYTPVPVSRREAIVELVDWKEGSHTELVVMVELRLYVFEVAGRRVLAGGEKAVEEVRDLDPQDDRELSVFDDFARFCRGRHDPEPALSWAPILRVDVLLHFMSSFDLTIDGDHVITRVALVLNSDSYHQL